MGMGVGKRLRIIARALLVLFAFARPHAARARLPAGSTAREARAFADSIYRTHFRAGQGFSLATLRATRPWFTPQLYALLLHDMDRTPDRGDIGYLDADPFTNAQDDADTFTVGKAVSAHDTLMVNVTIRFGPSYSPEDQTGRVTLAVLRLGGRWRIADFVYPSGSLAAALRAHPE